MAGFVQADVVEKILITLHVEDLMRCKSVCKSWYFLITSPGFVNRHLNHSYKKDRKRAYNRRIILVNIGDSLYMDQLVGSSNGMVCIFASNYSKLLVGNPLTREIRQLKPLPSITIPSCWGFGYDSYKDDYKVIVGVEKSVNETCVQVLSLKSNVWRVIGDMKYTFIRRVGMLCDGALHWIIKDQNQKEIIISYDLSKEEFKEIGQPDDARYEATSNIIQLGIFNECLCIYQSECSSSDRWLMKNHETWELLPDDCESRRNIVHCIRAPKDYVLPLPSRFTDPCGAYNKLPMFVQSLVSPHVKGRSNWASNNNDCQGNKRSSFGSWIKCLSLMLLDK
ncbi:hypothetical protein QVD17_01069 [Tagetes erecta]|uniref:F-box domain-containing protein n=1 Tax=Tagetes erecta TaxID=13708 RepID=A0AAD8L935_TARER|nr:hypothetical protein QVD17_01069 [Tagetes erecta]